MKLTDSLSQDPLARATETPDLAMLVREFEDARDHGPGNLDEIGLAEDIRLCRWPGKTSDGLRHQRKQAAGEIVRPYDHRPDLESHLVDETVNALVDMDWVAFWSAQVKPSPTHANRMTAAQSSELRCLVRWMKDGPLRPDLIEGVEYLSQLKNSQGKAVLHPHWRVKFGLRRETLELETFQQLGAQAPEESPLRAFVMAVLDPTLEENAVAALLEAYPYLRRKTARRVVGELRESGRTEFLIRDQLENRPALDSLVLGVDVFVSAGTEKPQEARAWFTRKFYTQAGLEAMRVDEEWDEGFIAAALGTAGKVSGAGTAANVEETRHKRIEIVTCYARQLDEADGVPVIYRTVYSPHLTGEGAPHAKHEALVDAPNLYPFVPCSTEAIGPKPDDARGAYRVLGTDQASVKRHLDALNMYAEMNTNPPRLRTGSGWSKVRDEVGPGADITVPPGAQYAYLAPPAGKPDVALLLIQDTKRGRDEYYNLPRPDTHPARWQAGQARKAGRWLLVWSQGFWFLSVLCYARYSPEELAVIFGRPPLLTARDLLQHQINLAFDARTMDMDWVAEVIKQIGLIRAWDTGGAIDSTPLVEMAIALLDTTVAQEVVMDQQGASAAVFREVQNDVNNIMLGNKPVPVENDPRAKMKMDAAMAIVEANPDFASRLVPVLPDGQANPQFMADRSENFQTYIKNLEHSHQEMVTSKIQGRAGVADVAGRPLDRKG